MSEEWTDELEQMRETIARLAEEREKAVSAIVKAEGMLELLETPAQKLQRARDAALELVKILQHNPGWILVIEGREYLTFNAWSTLGALLGLWTIITEVKELKDENGKVYGFEAHCQVLNRAEKVVSTAVARADRNEMIAEYEYHTDPKTGKKVRGRFLGLKKRFDEKVSDHAILALAQTRARRKALQACLNWVVGLTKYETTPAEEELELTP